MTTGALVRIDSTVRASVKITDLKAAAKQATLRILCLVKEAVVIDGGACVLAASRG